MSSKCFVKNLTPSGDPFDVKEKAGLADSIIRSFPQHPSPGDCTTVNNFISPDKSNSFVCLNRLTVAAQNSQGQKDQRVISPSRVSCVVEVDHDLVLYRLTVAFTNPFGKTAAAILEVPRLEGVLLLEEEHMSGTTVYSPEVMEKEQAQEAYNQAAASSTHSATLSTATESAIEVKLDKVPAHATAQFSLLFIQQGLRTFGKVVPSADDDSQEIADLVIVPGYTNIEAKPVPFALTIRHSPALFLDAISPEVLVEDAKTLADNHVFSLLAFSPAATASEANVLSFTSSIGFSTGTVIKARFGRITTNALGTRLGNLSLEDGPIDGEGVVGLDTYPQIMFDSATGNPLDVTAVDFVVPSTVPDIKPCELPHQVFLIMDTSGSTSMTVDGRQTFLDKTKVLLEGIITLFPNHLNLLRSRNRVNSLPVTVHLWSFNSFLQLEITVDLSGSLSEMEKAVAPVVAKIRALQSQGATNFDSWSEKLFETISGNPKTLNHVILLTDGGATSQDRFQSDIKRISKNPSVHFFQCDSLGYGPWLNPETVTFLAKETDGEAILIETPTGDSIRTKILGLLARSLLRAASSMELAVFGEVLAVQSSEGASVERRMIDNGKPFVITTGPGARLRISVIHPSDCAPGFVIGSTSFALSVQASRDGYGAIGSSSEQALRPETRSALDHLTLLEPAYSARTIYPTQTQQRRAQATLAISLKGQVMAPSVTRGCAVAKLEDELEPVPAHCQPSSSGPITCKNVQMEDMYRPRELLKCSMPKTAGFSIFPSMTSLSARSANSSPSYTTYSFASSSIDRASFPVPRASPPPPMAAAPYIATQLASLRSAVEEKFFDDFDDVSVPQTSGPKIPTVCEWLNTTLGGLYYPNRTACERATTNKDKLKALFEKTVKELPAKASPRKNSQNGKKDDILDEIDRLSEQVAGEKGLFISVDQVTVLRHLAGAVYLLLPKSGVTQELLLKLADANVSQLKRICENALYNKSSFWQF